MITRWTFFKAAITFAAYAFAGSTAVSAKTVQISRGNTVSCRWSEKTPFTAVLEDLAAQSHVTFVAEGQPFRSGLDKSLSDKFPSGTGNLEAVVGEVALRFDYDATRRGNVFHLTKRYSRPDDLPSVTFEECRQSLTDIIRASNRLNPRVPDSTTNTAFLLDPLVDSLDEGQKKAMKSGLSVSQLRDSQKAALQQMSHSLYFQRPVSALENTLERLEGSAQAEAKLVLETANGRSVLRYQYRSPKTGLVTEVPLLQHGTSLLSGATVGIDTDLPKNYISTQITGLDGSNRVDDYLAAKTAVIAGQQNSSPLAVMTAVARIYGLRVFAEPNTITKASRFRLSRPRAARVTDATELPRTVSLLVPAPLLRILRGASSGRRQEVRHAASLALARTATPTSPPKQETQIALSGASREVKDLLALVLMVDMSEAISKLTAQEQPRSIAHPDSVYLQGFAVHDDASGKGFLFILGYKNAQGELNSEMMIMRSYPKIPPK